MFLQFVLARCKLILGLSVILLVLGAFAFHKMRVDAYPQIAPLAISAITQWPGRSTLEMERQITIPVEISLSNVPGLDSIRSISMFGLSVVTVKFFRDVDSFHARQNFEQYLLSASLPNGVQPQLSPDSDAIGEIMRYRLVGNGVSLMDLTGYNVWDIHKYLRQVPGVAEVSNFGGLTKEYFVIVKPEKLVSYGVTLNQVINALSNANANVGGNLLHSGEQQYAVRGVGLLQTLTDMRNVVVAVNENVPVRIKDVAKVEVGNAERLGMVQFNDSPDIVQGEIMLRRGENATEVLARLRDRIKEINSGLLPPSVQIKPFYDRQNLLDITTHTVMHNLVMGMILVIIVLYLFLQNLKASLIVAATIPLALCASFLGMFYFGVPANLISLGAVDFGVIVNAAVIVMENIIRLLTNTSQKVNDVILFATAEVQRAVVFTTGIIIVSYMPLFFMGGVEGLIFQPMAFTMGVALLVSMILGITFTPVAASELFHGKDNFREPPFLHKILKWYGSLLKKLLTVPKLVLSISLIIFVISIFFLRSLGTDFLPTLEENNLWIRVTLPNTVDLKYSSEIANKIREYFYHQPEVAQVAVQIGRPDDGTDSTSVFNQEYGVYFKPPGQWPAGKNKEDVIRNFEDFLKQIPGIQYNFSQYIQDNVEEALSGVKGENTIKIFGSDLEILQTKARQIENIIKTVPGIVDVGIFRELGQPNLNVTIDRRASARFGVNVSDIDSLVQNAIGAAPVTTILEGERTYNLAIRLPIAYRNSVEAVRNLLIDTPDQHRIPLLTVASVEIKDGPFFIYREGGKRYIAVKFGVRGRDLGSAYHEARKLVEKQVPLASGYSMLWEGEVNEMERAQAKLMFIIPFTLLIIYLLLCMAFGNATEATIVLLNAPFCIIGGAIALYLANEPLSISAGIGFLSLFGIAIQNGVILMSYINTLTEKGLNFVETIVQAASLRLRPILMTSLLASLGLLPAAISQGIGSQVQRPLALVIVGGMLLSPFISLLILPVIYWWMYRKTKDVTS